jgi:hypothetical protein
MKTTWLSMTSAVAAWLTFSSLAHPKSTFPNYHEPDLPVIGRCLLNVPQPLPARWQAIALMAPFLYSGKRDDLDNLSSRAELQVGRFVYDGENRLMRGTRYGAKLGGVIDLMISDKNTWILTGSYEHPQCVATLSKPYKVPSRIWQDPQFQPTCVGNHAIAPTIDTGPSVDWWKQKSPITGPGANGEAADWYWMDQNGYPTRTMFWAEHDSLPAILGDYAFTNFYRFAPGNDIDLKKIASTCEQATLPVWEEEDVVALQTKTENQVDNPAGTLVPGLSYKACSTLDAKPPTWPANIYMTSLSTAAKYATPRVLATSVYYNPDTPRLRTRLHENNSSGGSEWDDALLIHESSYGVSLNGTAPYYQNSCARGVHTSLPGSPKKDWGVAGHCQCMSVLEDNPVLSPGRNTEIIGCPLPLKADESDHQTGNTMFWMWYAIADPMQPVVFMQTKPDVTIGTGLSLADYTRWQQKVAPDNVFTTPVAFACPTPPSSAPTPPTACMGCHNWSTNN